ncbi:MAG: ArsR/SmtB family transcription factor [Planctomycetaceae bacterium]
MKQPCNKEACDPCVARGDVSRRPLLDRRESRRLAAVFRVLANDTRLRLLHALVREPELPVGSLCQLLGMKPQAISNQLRRLARLGVVASRREGTTIHYRLIDRCVRGLLDQGLCLSETTFPQPRPSRRASSTSRVSP